MDDGSIFIIVALVILIGMSAFFSAAETAYNSLNQIRLKSKADDGDRQAAKVLGLAQRYDSLLSTILIGNNIVNIGASSLATVLFSRLVGNTYGPTVSTIVMTLLVLTFGEITPKSMAKEMPETMAMAFAPVLGFLVTIFTPLLPFNCCSAPGKTSWPAASMQGRRTPSPKVSWSRWSAKPRRTAS